MHAYNIYIGMYVSSARVHLGTASLSPFLILSLHEHKSSYATHRRHSQLGRGVKGGGGSPGPGRKLADRGITFRAAHKHGHYM